MVAEYSFLLVDDDAIVRRVLERAVRLAHPQAQAIEAATVAAALAALRGQGITAVITDFHLPDGTALDILAVSQALDPRRKVLVISGVAAVETAALQSGATAFLLKPVELSRLIAAIRQLH